MFDPALKAEWFSLVLKASNLVPVNDKDSEAREKDLLTSDELASIRRGQSEEEYLTGIRMRLRVGRAGGLLWQAHGGCGEG